MTFESKRRSFGAPSSTRPPLRGPKGDKGNPGAAGPSGATGTSVRAYGAEGDGVANDSAAITAALASGAAHVTFPAGTYKIGSAVTGSAAGQLVTFEPGAVLVVTPGVGLDFSGDRMRIVTPIVRIDAASSSTFTALTVSGDSSVVTDPYFLVNADVPNCTLLKLQGDHVVAWRAALLDVGKTFKYAVHAVATDGTSEADGIRLEGFEAEVGDDGANATIGALVYWRCQRGTIAHMVSESGTRQLFPNGVLIVDGHHTTLRKPKIFAAGATYGVYRAAGSEFMHIEGGQIQGRNNGTFVTSSLGIYSGHQAGHLKLTHGFSLTGFENGVGIFGQHDSFTAHGAVIVNNRYYPLVVDAKIAADSWGVRGINLVGCYLSDVYGIGLAHLISGTIEGAIIHGCQFAFESVGILVEDTVATLEGVSIDGCYIQGSQNGATPLGVIQPGVNTATAGVIFGAANKTHLVGALSTGTYADRAISIADLPFGALTVADSLTIGPTGDPIISRNATFFTANFGSGIPADDQVELEFTWSAANTARQITWSLAGALPQNTGLSFIAYVHSATKIRLRARNHTASPIGAISGTLFLQTFRDS